MILFLVFAFILLSLAFDTAKTGISPMPSSRKVKRALLKRNMNKTIYELGSGWGGIAFSLSLKNKVLGFETAFLPWAFSRIRQKFSKTDALFKRTDFFKEDLSQAEVIVCYLYPAAMKRLGEKLQKELKKGTLVFSNSFQIPFKTPFEVIEVDDWCRSKLYCYLYE